MDELAAAAGVDPLEFRLAHLGNEEDKSSPRYRLRAVLEAGADRFNWKDRAPKRKVALVALRPANRNRPSPASVSPAAPKKVPTSPPAPKSRSTREHNQILVRRVTQSYECGAIVNPDNLLKQVQGALIMGIGPALREAMQFENGQILNASFGKYKVPRFPTTSPKSTSTSSTVLNARFQQALAKPQSSPSLQQLPTPSFTPLAIAFASMPITIPEARKT